MHSNINYLKPLLGNNWVLKNKGINGELTGEMCAIPSLIGFDFLILPREKVNTAKYSSDGLHLNRDGYKLMGKLVYEKLLKSDIPLHTP